ncbi:MAG: DUF1566 domain-containing protein [Pseudomonas sp.]|uniref:DUF1566 domain-containing protein n=1 Tax=Pseudomonas sp. TaxID=306 RepID=UPI002734679B|nr:DUF1566 domain-containing protein [Pseudomonas sp.]MDP3848593.1 DUF1566 domain-containing protein [Pseudomonas sp.]
MNAHTQIATPTIGGTPFAGGFYAGRFLLDGTEYALIVAPKALGEHHPTAWGEYGQNIEGARSCNDGRANTEAMAAAGSALGQWALTLDIADHKDWYIPSRDELELCYRNLKPTTQENWASFRDGDNPSSVPVGYPYTEESPAQTTAPEFQEGGAEAFQPEWYYASTQHSPDYAWVQDFDVGYQDNDPKGGARRAVAVRRYKVSP